MDHEINSVIRDEKVTTAGYQEHRHRISGSAALAILSKSMQYFLCVMHQTKLLMV
jgi:hypothetical protein